jgi:hypothetical protein
MASGMKYGCGGVFPLAVYRKRIVCSIGKSAQSPLSNAKGRGLRPMEHPKVAACDKRNIQTSQLATNGTY